ncbi:Larval cuticle protein 16/17 [Frankliniella fusca]|uniref:Larval cuticle protein 16/17 n=1 Tax=Frankliniella fusca TaxID=407009 RepID=A0AAE1LKP0_9NEOP|nr:Larval cuticle protein 16/17 [Frankliniella fusca]
MYVAKRELDGVKRREDSATDVSVLSCLAAVAAQLPPRLEVPGAAPAPPQPQRPAVYRRPASRAYQQRQPLEDADGPVPAAPRSVVRVRRPTSRSRLQQVQQAQQLAQQAQQTQQAQPRQDFPVNLTPRPVSEEPEDAPLPPQPTRDAANAILPTASPSPSSPPTPSPSSPSPSPKQVSPAPSSPLPPSHPGSAQPQGALAGRFLQPAVYRHARPLGAPALQGGFRPASANDEDNVILARPSPGPGQANPRAYLPGTGPNAPSSAPSSTAAPLLELPLGPPAPAAGAEPKQPVFRPPPGPLTAIPAAQLQLAQQLAAQQKQAVRITSAQQVSSASSPAPSSLEDEDDEDEDEAVANPNRRQTLVPLPPFRATHGGNFLVTPSSLDLDDELPLTGFSPSVPRRPQQQQQVFRPSPPLDLDNNAFSPSPRPLPPQPQPVQRRPSPSPAPAPTPAPQPPARRPVSFRPERVNAVSPSPAPNVHVHQLLREDDDYQPVARPSPPPRPVARPQPAPQPRPAAPAPARPRPHGSAGPNKYQREKKPVAQVLRRYREDNPDGSITWGYENDDGSFKEETIGVDCMVRGKYGYIDPDGNRREYTYQSGIPCTPAPPGRDQADDQEGGYVDYQNNQYVLPNGQAISLDDMVKNRKRKPVGKARAVN